MKLALLIGFLALIVSLATLLVVSLYLHKGAGATDIQLIGELAEVETKLDPVGTVIVCGELWRARSKDGVTISPNARVRVIGFEGHFALVELCD